MARLLVIDDDELLRETVSLMLRSGGHEVVPAVDGADGIRLLQEQRFDLVLCDLIMPKQAGLEAIKEMRRLSPDIPIVSMTGSVPRPTGGAHLDPDVLRMSSEFGVTREIAELFRAHELLALIRQCLE